MKTDIAQEIGTTSHNDAMEVIESGNRITSEDSIYKVTAQEYYSVLLNVTMISQESNVMTKFDMLNQRGKQSLADKEISDEDLKRKKEKYDLEPTSDYNGT